MNHLGAPWNSCKVGYNAVMRRFRRHFDAVVFAVFCWGTSLVVLALTVFGLLRRMLD